MNGEYRAAVSAKVSLILFGVIAVGGGIYLMIYPFSERRSNMAMLVIGLISIGLGILFWRSVVKLRLTIDGQLITVETLQSSRSMLISEIDGYRVGDKNSFYLVSKDGTSLQIPVSIEQRNELIGWIKEKYEDVDQRAKEAETQVLLEDERFGASPDERKAALQSARRVTWVTTGAAIALVVWSVAYPQPFDLVLFLLIIAPLAGVYLVWRYKGLIKLYSTKRSPYPSVLPLMVMPVVGFLMMSLRYQLYGFPGSALLLILVGAVMLSVIVASIFRTVPGAKVNALAILLIVVVAAVYSYSLLVCTNCHYDHSPANVWKVPVTDKRVSHGKSTNYYIRTGPWGRFTEGKEVTVSHGFYSSVRVDDSVGVFLNKGRWGIPWYRMVQYGR